MKKTNAFYKEHYHQELEELRERFNNVTEFYYSTHRGTWILSFKKGEDQEFDTKAEAYQWLIEESMQD